MAEITLIPVAMIVPTRRGIYAPNPSEKPRQISEADFLARYADSPRSILVSFAPDGKSDPRPVTCYGRWMDCWWMVEEVE
jgi:hypothetical protein